jgi:hypothetical protein
MTEPSQELPTAGATTIDSGVIDESKRRAFAPGVVLLLQSANRLLGLSGSWRHGARRSGR